MGGLSNIQGGSDISGMLEQGWTPVEVRYEEEFEDGHLPGAILLPLPEWREQAAERLDKIG